MAQQYIFNPIKTGSDSVVGMMKAYEAGTNIAAKRKQLDQADRQLGQADRQLSQTDKRIGIARDELNERLRVNRSTEAFRDKSYEGVTLPGSKSTIAAQQEQIRRSQAQTVAERKQREVKLIELQRDMQLSRNELSKLKLKETSDFDPNDYIEEAKVSSPEEFKKMLFYFNPEDQKFLVDSRLKYEEDYKKTHPDIKPKVFVPYKKKLPLYESIGDAASRGIYETVTAESLTERENVKDHFNKFGYKVSKDIPVTLSDEMQELAQMDIPKRNFFFRNVFAPEEQQIIVKKLTSINNSSDTDILKDAKKKQVIAEELAKKGTQEFAVSSALTTWRDTNYEVASLFDDTAKEVLKGFENKTPTTQTFDFPVKDISEALRDMETTLSTSRSDYGIKLNDLNAKDVNIRLQASRKIGNLLRDMNK